VQPEEAPGVGEAVPTPEGVALSLHNTIVALLVESGRVTRLEDCMSRGYEYAGILIDERTVRLWNAT